MNICVYAPLILGAGISVDSVPAWRPLWLTCIESDNYSFIYTMFLLDIINAMMNLKQFGPLVLICVETNWPGSWFAIAVLCCSNLLLYNQVLNKIKTVDRISSGKWRI